jgi:uncharacterized protein (DUF305 family)
MHARSGKSRVGSFVRGSVGLAALMACHGAGGGGAQTSPEPDTGYGQASRQTTKPGRYPYTQADVDFMSGMIAHHRQALVMAEWAPTHGANASIRTLAERIINGQQDEIATMQRWLRDRGQPVPKPGAGGMKVAGTDHAMHHGLMPGMLTDAQMKELDQARGPEFDRLFLSYMIQHHRGALTMVEQLFGTQGAAQEQATFKLASDVSADQSSEITRMERMLAGLEDRPATP